MWGAVFCGLALQFFVAPSVASTVIKSLDIVILVDESSSLSSADVQVEIQAVAGLVSRRELSAEDLRTRVAIAGFGSGTAAVDEKCPPVLITTENVQELVDCAQLVRRRSTSGQHTDFSKAFAYASETFRRLDTPASARAVILMTDGKYDPVGKRSSAGLTGADQAALNEATAGLRADGAQIWPLGFGQVDRAELDELAEKGALSNCPAGRQPYAIVAEEQTLNAYLLEILGATICKKIGGIESLPYDYRVHPFVNEVTLTIRGATENPEVLVVGSNKVLCVDEWKRAQDESLACSIKVTGADTGVWRITSASSTPGVEPTVETSESGRIDLRLSACKETSAVVSVSRIDNTDIVWNVGSGFKFPRVALFDTSSREEIASTVLTASDRTATFSQTGMDSREIEVALASGQSDFVWLTASVDTCEIAPPVIPTTAIPTSTTDGGDSEDVVEPRVPWWLIVLIAVLIAAVLWIFRRRSKQGKFPVGAELRQRNVVQNPAAGWNTRADLSGEREMGFNVDRNGWLIEVDEDQADLVVRRIRSGSDGDFLVIQPARSGESGEASEGLRAPHAFTVAGESGSGIRFRDTFIRVEVPEEVEEEEFEEE